MSNRSAFVYVLTAAIFGMLLCVVTSCAEAKSPFGYKYLGTVGWVAGDGYVNSTGWVDGNVFALDTGVAFGRRPDLVAVSSSADFRWFVMSVNYIANTELMKTGLTAGQVDSLMAGAQAVPAAGKVYYGYLPWFVAHATPDTLWIDGYMTE